ncbi:MAG: transporter substrate-binding domain-containing protein [Synergistaceae bacterium]|nr:transporter substrate-binding domain-containing protein [Synergistaceae bacterium]
MKKFLCALLILLLVSSTSFAAAKKQGRHDQKSVNAGVLTYLGTTESEFQESLDDLRKAVAPLIPTDEEKGEWASYDRLEGFLADLVKTRRVIKFFDSLMSMEMALRAHKIDELALPEVVGLYLVQNNDKYDILFSLNMMPSTISFGFKNGNTKLQKEFNSAISAMKKDGTLAKLESQYITDLAGSEPKAVKFQEFKGAQTIKVAVTGDLPPIDFIAANGTPTGYNTAILSEIGKRLKKNIRLISIDAGGRSAALASERADVVFWYRNTEGLNTNKVKGLQGKNINMKDSIQGVILSEPYYTWDTDIIIGRRTQ